MFVRLVRFCYFMSNEAVIDVTVRLAPSHVWLLRVTVVHSSVC